MSKRNSALLFIIITIASIFGFFFIYPTHIGSKLYNYSKWKLGLDLVGGTYLIYRVDLSQVKQSDTKQVISALRDVIENRVNSFGVREPRVTASQSGGNYFLNVELAGIKDVSKAIRQIGETPFLQFAEEKTINGEKKLMPTDLTGRFVKDAQISYDSNTGRPYITLEFKEDGTKIFENLTAKNIGKPLAILLDGKILSAPIVQEKISGGRAQITGDFTLQKIKKLVRNINIGALPAPINLVNQETVGSTFGKESLAKYLKAGLVGTALVALFMIVYYGFFGFLASVALLIYIILSLSIFKLFVTMTLAGMGGFLLSVGMAVDANVLIFERTKEEIKNGMAKVYAVGEGFKRAWPSIRDGNVSTIITTLILFYITTGFVKGLALTLLLGVIISMFTAIVVTRGLMTVFLRNKERKK